MQDFRGLNRQVWHQRYLAQAEWTAHIRQHLFEKMNPPCDERILEIGSGTSAVIQALQKEGFVNLTGIDLDHPSLSYAKKSGETFQLAQADGMCLPFSNGSFGMTYCHFLLMWVRNPLQILAEMCRVTKNQGWVFSLAEPDHQARVDYPPPLDKLGHHQTQALENQGVDITIGRKLRKLFYQAGLVDVEVGILGALWDDNVSHSPGETEWMMIQADLADQLSAEQLLEYQKLDQQAYQTRKRILFIPTFYALGRHT